ncbi:hypothetical protein [Candidatus Cetobacterium colombiensis]|uniref:Uncharacterized protein n=1 Tax=Candidatus Cetobacterium colombiensis TaxID=3073100 RepID=A0ABU4WB87_9FUSO|nr:hypothetical protein [Candidatus Cetobacterium colombiensis]MDX8335934.1 hypothetical protein [Candidatus Cetobacterium colombiensis]
MIKILKVIYTILTVAGMVITGSNTLVLKDIGVKVEKMAIPKVTSHSQININ